MNSGFSVLENKHMCHVSKACHFTKINGIDFTPFDMEYGYVWKEKNNWDGKGLKISKRCKCSIRYNVHIEFHKFSDGK